MTRPFVISGARVTHEQVPVATLEAAAHDEPGARMEALAAREDVSEAFVLHTCNRVEEYVVTEAAADGRAALSDFAETVPPDDVVHTDHEESLRHLLRVAAGLESQVLGEDQILGQVRAAYQAGQDRGTVGPVLEPGLLKAIHVGERARSETAINEGIVSLGSAAAALVERERGLDRTTVLVVGAGEMATNVARTLADRDVGDLRLVNRTVDRAARLAGSLPGSARADGLGALPGHCRDADAVVSATGSPEPVIERDALADAGETLIVDLARPRDVAQDAAGLPDVTVRDLDGLTAITEGTHAEREAAAAEVQAMIEEEFDLLMDQYKRKRADAVIKGMYAGAERIKDRELSTAAGKLADGDELDDDEREVLEGLADALVSQLLAVPTESLREAAAEDDWETITTAIELFEPAPFWGAPRAASPNDLPQRDRSE